jgi:hypothetical protein
VEVIQVLAVGVVTHAAWVVYWDACQAIVSVSLNYVSI